MTDVFKYRKWRFSNTLSRVESFENRDSSYLCGQAKMEAFKYNVVMPRFKARSSTHMIVVFENTLLFVNGQIRFKNAMCGCRFF